MVVGRFTRVLPTPLETLAEGREAALDIDSVLTGARSRLPSGGADAPFTTCPNVVLGG